MRTSVSDNSTNLSIVGVRNTKEEWCLLGNGRQWGLWFLVINPWICGVLVLWLVWRFVKNTNFIRRRRRRLIQYDLYSSLIQS
jgi:hypothetical protein